MSNVRCQTSNVRRMVRNKIIKAIRNGRLFFTVLSFRFPSSLSLSGEEKSYSRYLIPLATLWVERYLLLDTRFLIPDKRQLYKSKLVRRKWNR